MFAKSFAVAMAAVMLAVAGASARAQSLDMQLDDAFQTGTPGATLTFSGSLQNLNPTELFLNGVSLTIASPDMSADATKFINNAPLSLQPMGAGDDFWSGELFDILIGAFPAPGTYFGSFTVMGGDTDTDMIELASQTFSVAIPAAAPEPGALGLLCGAGVTGLGILLRRRKRA